MLAYIKAYIDTYKSQLKKDQSLVKELASELERLDVQDFEPAVQTEFMFARAEIQRFAEAKSFTGTMFDDVVKQRQTTSSTSFPTHACVPSDCNLAL